MNDLLVVVSLKDIFGFAVLGLLVLVTGGYWIYHLINDWIYNWKKKRRERKSDES